MMPCSSPWSDDSFLKTNRAGQDNYNGYTSQVVHDHWNPNETCISFPWSDIIKLSLERNVAVLVNSWWGCNGPSMIPWSSPKSWRISIIQFLVLRGNQTLDQTISGIKPSTNTFRGLDPSQNMLGLQPLMKESQHLLHTRGSNPSLNNVGNRTNLSC